ncbi:unnamed protein product [Trifolium pratense]|uniref:Uncharacterized protein n=1 Tax=Trifolium pratense TaxID=57577 RepID=A0ACB0L0V0_TRIPR|nr:unnamed protein product [Trifolium pratense]
METTFTLFKQTSSYRVLSRNACLSSMRTNSIGSYYSRGISSAKVVPLSKFSNYRTHSKDDVCSSKRRSRGPVMAGKKAAEGIKQDEGKYKHTVDLPKTAFAEVISFFMMRPPYANGDLHIGHALNKTLKDIINRYKLLQNYKVHFVPGWDCHGLPIELKVLQSLDKEARNNLTPLKLRAKAAKFAKDTVKNQMSSFKRFGVWADWNNPYLTLDPEYEAAQIEVFGQMALKGYIYRGRKPVHWSPSSRIALAEAELEYPEGHVSKSIYAIFRVASAPVRPSDLLQEFPNLCLAIWTTTPWTIPANAAIAAASESFSG